MFKEVDKCWLKDIVCKKKRFLKLGKFTILWNWFERSWCHNNCNPGKIKQIATRIHIDEEKQAHLAEVLNERRNWFGQLEAEYVRDSLHPDNARASREEDMDVMRQFITQSEGELTRGCLLVLHRIRNNLMHGMKLLEGLDGQIELFRAATAVLESIDG